MIREDGTDEQMKACIVEAVLPREGEQWRFLTLTKAGTLEFETVLHIFRVNRYWVLSNFDIDMLNWPLWVGSGKLKLIEHQPLNIVSIFPARRSLFSNDIRDAGLTRHDS